MSPSEQSTPQGSGPSVPPPTDQQSRAQVVDIAKEVVRAANLRVTYASFQWEWCDDQGEPPYHGRVDLAFETPVDRSVSRQIAEALAGQPGWAPGPPPGSQPAGDAVHKGAVMVLVGPGHYPDRGAVEIYGECRNTNDHRDDTELTDITTEIRGY
ncbi:hypothetical protein C6A87_000300 [Mycobacterium sp. ITM-2016-00317]|uniref:hypothetical protein n=1 Tax=Mycobacterium sp. ITM-2016-00317 TaxID=2099694 RepID=UPI00287F5C2B|nr:hypothetical protein [Mycobacterium sp. ITM-2016-00317]WNG87777.1 hypothetical protein C6A87_000300 [Mycobacterium sp. ITM-2016-00317]